MNHASSNVLCVAIGLGVLLAGCARDAPEDVESEAVVPVTTEPAQLGAIRGLLHATGLVTPAPGAELVVIAPEPARIAEIPKAEGDPVRRGDLLVRFDIPTVRADAESRRAEVARAKTRLATARAADARARDLLERGIAARRDVEDAERELADAQAALEQAMAALRAAETLTGRTAIRASFDGIVAKRSHNPGDLVEASASDPVLRVIDPRRLEVQASVPVADVPRLVVGASARIVGTPAGTPVPLAVVSRPAAVEQGTASVPVRLGFASPTTYPAGLPVQVEIDAEEHRNVVLVPAAAIVREGSETAVFVAAGGKAQRRSVATGLSDDRRVEVLSGVKPGEQVITRGHAGLPDGAAVAVAAAKQ